MEFSSSCQGEGGDARGDGIEPWAQMREKALMAGIVQSKTKSVETSLICDLSPNRLRGREMIPKGPKNALRLNPLALQGNTKSSLKIFRPLDPGSRWSVPSETSRTLMERQHGQGSGDLGFPGCASASDRRMLIIQVARKISRVARSLTTFRHGPFAFPCLSRSATSKRMAGHRRRSWRWCDQRMKSDAVRLYSPARRIAISTPASPSLST